jgi:hypothetical protein
LGAALLLPSCAGTDRPEGVVERWLIALNQGSAGRPSQYAPEALSQQILPHWASRDPGDIDTIEVGKAVSVQMSYIDHRLPLNTRAAEVPYRVVLKKGGIKMEGVAEMVSVKSNWQIVGILPPAPLLKLPSEGGPRIGSASLALWLGSLGVALILTLITIGLMATVGRDRALLHAIAAEPSLGGPPAP